MTDSPEQPSLARYAVYYAPPADSGLWQRAQQWLGRDCESGATQGQPLLDGWTASEIEALTESPRHYGFHATLKAPFHLAPGRSERALYDALVAFAAEQRPFLAPPLKVSAIGSFIALTLSAPSPEMQALAAAAVRDLDGFRAPPAPHDIQRRLGKGLSEAQEALLHRWGYPYVMEEFRFHMTLTAALPEAEPRARLQTQLAALFRPELGEAVPVDEICLYSQTTRDQPFRLLDRYRLGTAAASGVARDNAQHEQGQTSR